MVPAGEACTNAWDCAPSPGNRVFCTYSSGSSSPGTCVVILPPAQIGDVCSSDGTPTNNGSCALGSYCSQNSVCVALPAVGAACSPVDGCAAGAYCGSAGVCTVPKPDGATCQRSEECSSVYCQGTSARGICGTLTIASFPVCTGMNM
jgi:hypothetical protein